MRWRTELPAALGAIALCLLMLGCDSVQPSNPTPSPTMVPYVDNPFAQTGIRADPDAGLSDSSSSGAIIVEWRRLDPAKISGVRLGGYYVYRSDTIDPVTDRPLNFRRISKIALSPTASDTSISDGTVRQNVIYSYYVTSYNRSDESQESPPSDTVNFTLSTRPVPVEPISEAVLPTDDTLSFIFGPSFAGGLTAIEVNQVDPVNERILIRKMWSHIGSAGYDPPQFSYAGADPLVRGARYRWRVVKYFPNVTDRPIGNASRWVTFTAK